MEMGMIYSTGEAKGEFPASKSLITNKCRQIQDKTGSKQDQDMIKKDGNSVEQDPAVWDGYLTRLSSPAQPGLVRPVFKQPGLWVVFGGGSRFGSGCRTLLASGRSEFI